MLGTILLIILVLALLGGFRDWGRGPFYGTGYYGGGGLGILLVVVLLLVVADRIWEREHPPIRAQLREE
jgi:hypothetical protein